MSGRKCSSAVHGNNKWRFNITMKILCAKPVSPNDRVEHPQAARIIEPAFTGGYMLNLIFNGCFKHRGATWITNFFRS